MQGPTKKLLSKLVADVGALGSIAGIIISLKPANREFTPWQTSLITLVAVFGIAAIVYQLAPGGQAWQRTAPRSSRVAPRERADRATPGRRDGTAGAVSRIGATGAHAVVAAITHRPGMTRTVTSAGEGSRSWFELGVELRHKVLTGSSLDQVGLARRGELTGGRSFR